MCHVTWMHVWIIDLLFVLRQVPNKQVNWAWFIGPFMKTSNSGQLNKNIKFRSGNFFYSMDAMTDCVKFELACLECRAFVRIRIPQASNNTARSCAGSAPAVTMLYIGLVRQYPD